jgi:hypothetical protein
MISVLRTGERALVILVLLTSACQRQQAEMWRASDPTYVPFAVKEIAASADNRFVALTVDERAGHGDETLASNLTTYSTTARTGMDTIDILDVSKRRVVKSWPHPEGSVPVEWSGNGEATVTVRDHRVVFEPLGETILDGANK